MTMPDCDELRAAIVTAKRERNFAEVANAEARNVGQPATYSDDDREALRMAVEIAAYEAKQAGCDIDDLVGPDVGNLDDR